MKSAGYFLFFLYINNYCQEFPPIYPGRNQTLVTTPNQVQPPNYSEHTTIIEEESFTSHPPEEELPPYTPSFIPTERTRLYENEGDFLRRHFHQSKEIPTRFITGTITKLNYTTSDRLIIETEICGIKENWMDNIYSDISFSFYSSQYNFLQQIYHDGPEKLYATTRIDPDAVHLITNTENGTIKHNYTVNLSNSTASRTLPQLFFNPYKKQLLIHHDNTWNSAEFNSNTVKIKHNLPITEPYNTLDTKVHFSPTGHLALIDNQTISIKKINDENFFSFFETTENTHFAFNPNPEKAQFLLQRNNQLDLYNTHTGSNIASSRIHYFPKNVFFSGTGNFLIGLDQTGLKIDIINTQNYKTVTTLCLKKPAHKIVCSSIPTSDAFIFIMAAQKALYYRSSCNENERLTLCKGNSIKEVQFDPDNDKKFIMQEGRDTLRHFDFTQQNSFSRYFYGLNNNVERKAFVSLVTTLMQFQNSATEFIDLTQEDSFTKAFKLLPPELQEKLIEQQFVTVLEAPPAYQTIIKKKRNLFSRITRAMIACFNRNK